MSDEKIECYDCRTTHAGPCGSDVVESARLSWVERAWRWVRCKAMHTSRLAEWDYTEVAPGVVRRTFIGAWCGDCHRPLQETERLRCDQCGQPVNQEPWPKEMT